MYQYSILAHRASSSVAVLKADRSLKASHWPSYSLRCLRPHWRSMYKGIGVKLGRAVVVGSRAHRLADAINVSPTVL